MNKKKFKIISILLFITAIIFSSFVFYFSERNEVETTQQNELYTEFKDNQNFDFNLKRPSTWKLDRRISSDESYRDNSIYLTDENSSFRIQILSQRHLGTLETNCSQENPCGLAYRIPLNYEVNSFELHNIDNEVLMLSKTGGIKRNYNKDELIIESSSPQLDTQYYIYQRVDTGMIEELTLFGHGNAADQTNGNRLIISYSFLNEEAIQNWDKNKLILTNIISSLNTSE